VTYIIDFSTATRNMRKKLCIYVYVL